jgi:hypothetical protein
MRNNEITTMRNSLMLVTLETALILATSNPLGAQAPPAATTRNQTNEAAAWGILDSPVVFEWKSGELSSFLSQIKAVFGIDLKQRADIPEQMLRVRVPSMKITTYSVWDVLDLYNSISNDHPESGKWAVKRRDSTFDQNGRLVSEPNAVFLVAPNQTNAEDALSVQAFSLRDIPKTEQNQLFELIKMEGYRLKLETERGIKASLLRGDVHFHQETDICVATGGKAYVEMVGSLIDAFRKGRRFGTYTPKPQDEK